MSGAAGSMGMTRSFEELDIDDATNEYADDDERDGEMPADRAEHSAPASPAGGRERGDQPSPRHQHSLLSKAAALAGRRRPQPTAPQRRDDDGKSPSPQRREVS